jgi:hypothetical protein
MVTMVSAGIRSSIGVCIPAKTYPVMQAVSVALRKPRHHL